MKYGALIGLLIAAPLCAFDTIQLQQTITAPASVKDFTPEAVAPDAQGRLWVVDTFHHRFFLFSASGELLQTFGRKGSGVGEVHKPFGIAIWNQRVYITDSGNARVQMFGLDGKWQGTFGEKGSAPGQFREPWSIAVSPDGVVAVADRQGTRVQFFSPDGIFLHAFDTGSPIDAIAIDPSARIYTAHGKTHTIHTWTAAGQMKGSWTGQEPGLPLFGQISALSFSSNGLLYVADQDAYLFREMDLTGHTVGTFGRKGNGDGQFRWLSGLAASRDTIYASDRHNRRILVLTITHSTPSAQPAPAPLSRMQVKQGIILNGEADLMATHRESTLHTMRLDRPEVVTWDLTTKTTSSLELKRSSVPVRSPTAITAAPSSGNLFIADDSLDKIFKIDQQDGRSLLEFKNLSNPRGLACTTQGVLLVVDAARFQAFNHQGLFQYAGGEKGTGPGQLKQPVAIASDKDRVYVADAGNRKVSVYNAAGRFIHDLGLMGPEPLENPVSVAVDREGNLFVLDAARSRVVVFDPAGVLIGGFGAPGPSFGFLRKPRSMTLNERGDLFIAEERRIQSFRVDILPPAPSGLSASAGEGYIALRWEAVKLRFPSKYLIYRSSGTGLPELVQETVETTWTDDRVTPEVPYTYTVSAQSVSGATSVPSLSARTASRPITSGPRLEIVSTDIEDVFSAYYKAYSRTPFARVTIKNNSQAPASKVKVSFAIGDFMDFPSEVILDEVRSMETREVPLTATFNNRILSVTETTPIQAQLKLSYFTGEQETAMTRNLPFKLYSRNSIRWDRKERFAAFVTPNDPPVIDFARGIALPYLQAHAGAPLPPAMATAWAVFSGLGVYGMHYAPRPTNPYDRVSLDSSTVDTLQFARETLSRQSGDCADVVALLASALESLTLPVVALDAPGHLFLMFDTGETQVEELGFPEEMFVRYAGTWWVPLEATMLGESFTKAWKQGAEQYRRWNAQGKVFPIDIHRAWGQFEPATLPDNAAPVKAPTVEAVDAKFLADWKGLVDWRWQSTLQRTRDAAVRQPGVGEPALAAGLVAVQFKKYQDATKYFQQAKNDPATASAALNNLGNLAMVSGDLSEAMNVYQLAAEKDPTDGQILINLARAQKKAGKTDLARKTLDRALGLQPSLLHSYADLDSL